MSKPLLKYYLLLSLIALLLPTNLFAQKGFGDLYELELQENGDTLRVSRTAGDFWFGLSVNGMTSIYFGSLFLPVVPTTIFPVDSTNPEIPLTGRFGLGYSMGMLVEYNPPDARYGFTLKGNYEQRFFTAESAPFTVESNSQFITAPTSTNYYTISGLLRYNIYDEFFISGGLDIETYSSNTKKHITSIKNSASIEDLRKLDLNYLNVVSTRYCANFGIGYDIYVADINQGNRIMVQPYINLSLGTEIYDKDPDAIAKSTLNNASLRFGAAIKYSRDSKKADTLKLDTNAVVPTSVLVTAQIDDGVSFSGFQKQELVETSNLTYVPDLNAGEQVSEEPVFAKELAKDSTKKEAPKLADKPKIDKIEVGKPQAYSFPSGESVTLSQKMKDQLSGVADFLKLNPNSFVEIIGYSDNRGTPAEVKKRSEDRANNAKRYLISKGVSREKIFARGEGATKPKATNDTEEGRRQNRRIEINVKKK